MYREINKSDCPRIEYKKMAGGFYSYKVKIDELPGRQIWRYQFEKGLVVLVTGDDSGIFKVSYLRDDRLTSELMVNQPDLIVMRFEEFFKNKDSRASLQS